MTRSLSLSFGIQLFTPILTKAEKWEIEDKFQYRGPYTSGCVSLGGDLVLPNRT